MIGLALRSCGISSKCRLRLLPVNFVIRFRRIRISYISVCISEDEFHSAGWPPIRPFEIGSQFVELSEYFGVPSDPYV